MNIGINGYEAVVPRFGFDKNSGLPNRVGSGEFCYRLLISLFEIDKKNNYFVYLPVSPALDMPKESVNWHYIVFKAKKLWTMIGLSERLVQKKEKLDVFFSPTHYLPLITSCPTAISIMDLSYLHFPDLFSRKDLYQLKFWGGYSIRKAKKIITISESSKNDIIKQYRVNESKIAVIYPGVKQESRIMKHELSREDLKTKFGINDEYILFVGTLQPRKNITRLIEAFSKLKENDLELVIIGKKGWQYEEMLEAPRKFNVEDRVKFLDSVSNEDLPSFYKNALCFVLPSLYEGFGLPVLEAMQYGCPVAISNVSSLPEAGGDAALYFDPLNSNEIAQKLDEIISDPKLRQDLIKKGYNQIKKFSWETTAKETLKVLEELGKSS